MEEQSSERHWAVVLAGGDGTRLQELTREITGAPIPKQYCRIVGERSMLQTTLLRTQHYISLQRTLVVISSNHLDIARRQLAGLPAGNVLVQPCNRDTGPGLLFGLLALAQRDASAIVSVFPSDHYVEDDRAFMAHVKHAAGVVARLPSKIVLLGIRPDRPEPGYGYILPAEPLTPLSGNGSTFHVACFREKPPLEVAQGLLGQGGLWNSFVMVFHVARMLELLRSTVPAQYERMAALGQDPTLAADLYRDLQGWNFSSNFLMRIPHHLLVLQVDNVHWSDWGTRDAIERTLNRLTQRPPWKARVATRSPAAA